MTPITSEVIDEITRRIVREVEPQKIVLFGSCVRGEIGRDSDVDLLVVEDQAFGPNRSRYKETGRIRRSLRGLGVPIDLLVFSRDEVEHWKDATNHIVRIALREGKTVYERS